jgi:hypothetical protein
VKVLFVGEGLYDIGNAYRHQTECKAGGVVPTLTQLVCPSISEAIALRWTHVPLIPMGVKRLDRGMKTSGYRAKVKRAILLSSVKYGCDGTVCVADGDTAPDDCLDAMNEVKEEALRVIGKGHFVACGVAFQSIEAWTLGEPEAIAQEIGVSVDEVRG